MTYTTPTLEMLERAVDVTTLRQSVYAANIANAGVDGYRRLEVSFADELQSLQTPAFGFEQTAMQSVPVEATPVVVATSDAVRLDEEVALMARNALRHQILLGAFERSLGAMRLALEDGGR